MIVSGRSRSRSALRGAAAFVLIMLAAARASATPLVAPQTGGLVFVGPTSAHPSAIFWNPAAAGLQRGTHFHLAAGVDLRRTTIERAPIDTRTGEPASSAAASTTQTFAPVTTSPLTPGGFAGVTSDLDTDRVTLGVAVYTPFAEELAPNEDALRYHARGGSFYAPYGTLSVSFRAASTILLGAGLSAVYPRVDLRFARDVALGDCNGTTACAETDAATQRYDLTTGWQRITPDAISFNAGAMVKLSDRLWLAAAYHSPPSSTASSTTAIPSAGGVVIDPAPHEASPASGDARVTFHLPQMVQAGARVTLLPGRWFLHAGLRWVDLSTHRDLDLRVAGPEVRALDAPEWLVRYRGLRDLWAVDVGVEQPAGGTLRVGARLRLENGAVPESHVAPNQIDGPSATVAAGLEFRLTPTLALSLQGTVGALLPRTVDPGVFTPSGEFDCTSSGYDLDRCIPAREGRALPSAAGDYNSTTFGLLVALSYDRL